MVIPLGLANKKHFPLTGSKRLYTKVIKTITTRLWTHTKKYENVEY